MKLIGFIAAFLGMALILSHYAIIFIIEVYFPQIGKYYNKEMELCVHLLAILLMAAGTALLVLTTHNP
ncbi:MAG: hypothetical protein SFX18_10880 [Pirellulales bacterium]|nr:hypothetical protein [Pirellulales bacterium]